MNSSSNLFEKAVCNFIPGCNLPDAGNFTFNIIWSSIKFDSFKTVFSSVFNS